MTVILRRLYLGSLGGIFLIAFLSYYQQYPGLSSSSSSGGGGGGGGIIPAETMFRNNFPQSWKFTKNFIDTDSLCDVLCIVGVVCSCLIIQWSFVVVEEEQRRRQPSSSPRPPPPPYGILFLILTSIYSFLRVLGGTFYSFQWDILLLETGLLTGICYVPPGLWYILFFQQKQTTTKKDDGDKKKISPTTLLSSSSSLGTWPLRFLLFKLMFMSGVVKIQSQCPTWLNLTALEYHFATQPLPGPLSWHVQQVHPFLLRLSVAATFVIEIPFSFLLVAPTLFLRRFAAVMQISLQVIILLTGNYTFFNLLTIVLCIPCLENDNNDDYDISYDNNNTTTETTESRQNRRQNWSMYYWVLQIALCFIFLVISCIHLFRIDKIADNDSGTLRWNVRLAWTAKECDEFIDQTIPIVVPATILFLIVTGMNRIIVRKKDNNNDTTNIRRLIGILVHLVICVWCIGVISIPLIQQLTRQLRHTGGYHGSNRFVPMYQQAQKYALTSGYGLFRRMTGVGQYDNDFDSNNNWGWAGLPPSIVARPELILEAKLSSAGKGDDDEVWHELQFKWKPGNMTSMPKQIAPHHARLDWQMWFAALGHYQHNPWLLSLIDKLLHGCQPVIDLLMTDDDQQLLFLSSAQSPSSSSLPRRITEIRVSLYHYDFTRTSSEWNRRIPNVDIVSNDTWLWKFPERYWTRKFDSQYLPPLTANNPSLQDFISHHGYNSGRTCATANEDDGHRCNGMQLTIFCRFSSFVRRNQSDQLLLWIPFVVILFGLVSRRFKTHRASTIKTMIR